MLLVVTTPTGGNSANVLAITLACVHRMPEGMTNRPRILFPAKSKGAV